MADVTVKYKGSTILDISASGSATLNTAGKFCEADILLEYTKSAAVASGVAYVKVTYPSGSTVTCSDGTTSLSGADTSGVAIFGLPNTGNWTISCTNGSSTASDSVAAVENGFYEVTLAYFSATINATWPAGSTCTCTKGSTTLTAPNTAGSYAFEVTSAGTWTIACTDGSQSSSQTVTAENNHTYSVALAYIKLEAFGTTSDDNFVKLIQAAHNGTINLQTDAGWKVGDKRTISISAFTGGGSVSHAAQSIDIAIGSFANYENCGCVLQFDFVDELAAGNRMEASNINTNGYGGSEMYKTTLPALVNALPAYLRGLLIEFSCKASAGNKSTTIKTVTGNKLALRSEVEIFGTTSYSVAGEGSQIPYYTTSANRVKKRGHSGSADSWWERSPRASNATRFCFVAEIGLANADNASSARGVAPFGCI